MHKVLMIATALALALAGCAEEAAPADAASERPAGGGAMPVTTGEAGATDDATAAAPHAHDYWAGRERVTLVDATYEVSADDAVEWGVLSALVLGTPSFGGREVTIPEGQLVYEGTGRVEITVSWTDPTVTAIGFFHRHAGSGDVQPRLSAPNGGVVSLDVTPEMTDMPHAQASRWAFLFLAEGQPALAVGAFHVRMDAVKTRDVALWPAHPDLWGEQTQLVLLDADGVAASKRDPMKNFDWESWGTPEDALLAQQVVPMETAWILATVTVQSVSSEAALEGLYLQMRTAADLEFDFDDLGAPASVSEDGLTWTWNVTIAMEQADSPYAEQSAFAFRATAGYENPVPGGGTCEDGCYEAELRYHLTAVAHKAAPEPAVA